MQGLGCFGFGLGCVECFWVLRGGFGLLFFFFDPEVTSLLGCKRFWLVQVQGSSLILVFGMVKVLFGIECGRILFSRAHHSSDRASRNSNKQQMTCMQTLCTWTGRRSWMARVGSRCDVAESSSLR